MPEPVAVDIVSVPALPAKLPDTPAQEQHKAEAQVQESQVAVGQRRINIIWEYTQSFVAVCVVMANLAVMVHIGFAKEGTFKVPEPLSNALFLVVGFYFSRTNHTAVGGVGPKLKDYEGR